MNKLLLLFIGIVAMFFSCKKYEEGPAFSLLTKKSRVSNTWELDKYYENGVDKTNDAVSAFKDFTLFIDKNNMKYSKSFSAFGLIPYGETGSWKFTSDMESIEFDPENYSLAPYTWKIIKLKNTSLGFSYTSNSVNVKLYLK